MQITRKRIVYWFIAIIFSGGAWFGLEDETTTKFVLTLLFISVLYQHALIQRLFGELKKQTITIKALLNCANKNFADRVIQNLKKEKEKE